MTNRPYRKRGLGVIQVIICLLITSAFLRFGAQAGPAMANDAVLEMPDEIETNGQSGETETLLAALQSRASRLTEREEQLQARMQALRTAEEQIDEKLLALARAEAELSATIALADAASETDLVQLTAVYENMKPKEAADLFAQMPPQFAAGFLGMMRPDTAALIMTELDPEIAYSFSVVLAGRNANVPTE